ncbi:MULTISPECIES: hypothetical protein [unclassified Isoptericola]|uniref:hypothetical protein n=1 Tax=unclassified Isoptericola TaxID=2623355 RepID=UPI002712822D|nr:MULTISPECIES: hypothetical protein [unclassified Isoptericola]MDO8144842.1 hypothetical protein [Isoptericola sp. 178]MDO8149622.1 hypothetical protein [Isoptericola sp. b515]MDO8152556.1 hypothetical protein [Isoptericola sp. b408]
MWGWIWTVLALAAVVFLAWLAWRVVRTGLALLRTAAEAGSTWGEAAERVGAAAAAAQADPPRITATMFEDRAVLRARREQLRRDRWERRDRRRVDQAAVWRTWSESTWLERRQAERRADRHP